VQASTKKGNSFVNRCVASAQRGCDYKVPNEDYSKDPDGRVVGHPKRFEQQQFLLQTKTSAHFRRKGRLKLGGGDSGGIGGKKGISAGGTPQKLQPGGGREI